MTTPPIDPVLFTFFNEIGIISQLSTKAFEQVLPHGMTISQFSLLNNLTRLGDGKSPSSLATAFQVTKGAITNTLLKLEASGFVEVRIDENDGRGKKVFITEAGFKARQDGQQAQQLLLNELMKSFSETEFSQSIVFLARIRAYLDAARD